MRFDYKKQKKELISVVLSCLSVLFAVLVFVKITTYFKLSASARDMENLIQTMKTDDSNKPGDLNKYLSPTKEIANSLKKSNLFAPPPEKRNPITQIQCILGNEVWINDKWYKEGEMCQDAKIVRIEPTQVTIEWDGKTNILRTLDAPMASSGPGERPSSGGPSGPAERPPSGPGNPPISGISRGTISPPPSSQGQPLIMVEKQQKM